MPERYSRLNTHALPAGTPVFRYLQGLPDKVTMKDPAIDVMTDLRRVKAITVEPGLSIDAALQKMRMAEVRSLVVVDVATTVIGLITVRDITGEKPINYTSLERVPRREIHVEDVMTPQHQIEVLSMEDVYRCRVGDIVRTLREAGRQHALVLDRDAATRRPVVRGIFSITQIGNQLGVVIEASGRVQSFAEVEALLAG